MTSKNKLYIVAFTILLTITSSYASLFNKNNTASEKTKTTPAAKTTKPATKSAAKSVKTIKTTELSKHIIDITKTAAKLHAQTPNLDPKVLRLALNAYDHAAQKGIVNKPYLTIIDYSKPSYEKRMWVVDLKRDAVPFYTYVAHGSGSGVTYATHFSNQPRSKESSLGTFLTANSYYGHKGIALRLKGLEPGINSNALSRAIVMHGAWYMDPGFIKKVHRGGRSWGCPAVSTQLAKPIINTIKNGSVIFAYYPKQQFLAKSSYVSTYV